MEYLLTFPSTHIALKAEECLKRADLPFRLLPTPSKLVSGCGLSIGFREEVKDRILKTLKEGDITFRCYRRVNNTFKPEDPY